MSNYKGAALMLHALPQATEVLADNGGRSGRRLVVEEQPLLFAQAVYGACWPSVVSGMHRAGREPPGSEAALLERGGRGAGGLNRGMLEKAS